MRISTDDSDSQTTRTKESSLQNSTHGRANVRSVSTWAYASSVAMPIRRPGWTAMFSDHHHSVLSHHHCRQLWLELSGG